MRHVSKNFILKKRRGVSQIIGSLIVLALVASIGSIILFQGLNQINVFNYDLEYYDETRNYELREDVIFEHVRFIPGTEEVELYLANIGTVETTISSVTMVHNESQELVLAWAEPDPAISTIQLDQNVKIPLNATLLCPNPSPVPSLPNCTNVDDWNDNFYNASEYKISITTSRGNFFSTIATPWNT